MNPNIAAAQALVASLKAGGMSYGEIARRVGRDVSYISQTAKGKKGGNLVTALQGISGGAKKVSVPRKATAAGVAAKVRKGIQKVPGGDNISVKTKTGDKTLVKALTQMKGKGKQVKWKVKAKKLNTTYGTVHKDSGVNGGSPRIRGKKISQNTWTPEDLLNRIQNPLPDDNWKSGEARKAMAEIAIKENSDIYASYSGLQEVQMYTVD